MLFECFELLCTSPSIIMRSELFLFTNSGSGSETWHTSKRKSSDII